MEVSTQSILIIEDNATNMRLVHDLLKGCGYAVLQATDGTLGLQMAQEHRPSLILLDIALPGLNGLDVIRRLKKDEDLRSIPVIAVTACAMNGDEETCMRSGFDAYVSKPISIPDLLETVKRFLAPIENVFVPPVR